MWADIGHFAALIGVDEVLMSVCFYNGRKVNTHDLAPQSGAR